MNVKWYYQVMGEIRGPVNGNELRGCVNRNEISRDSYIRREQEDWFTADRIDELYPKPEVNSRSIVEPKMYYQVMGDICGPVSTLALRRLANTNSINRDTMIRQDNEEWVSADRVPGLLP